MKIHAVWMAMALIGAAATAGEFAKQPVGPAGGWANTIAGAALDGKLYTVEAGGKLYATDPADGSWSQLGGADFGNVVHEVLEAADFGAWNGATAAPDAAARHGD